MASTRDHSHREDAPLSAKGQAAADHCEKKEDPLDSVHENCVERWTGYGMLKRVYILVGWRFMVYMFVNYFFLKGMSYGSGFGILEKGIIPYYNEILQASGSDLNLASGTISPLAYSVKPLMAIVVDLFPIWGYHKRFYVVIVAVIAVICNLLLATLPADKSWAPYALPLAFLFAMPVFECALTDLLCEATYARIMRENPKASADIPTYAFTIVNIGALVAPQLVGHLADTVGPKAVFFVAAAIGAPIIIPALLGWQPEEKVDTAGTICWCGKPNYEMVKKNWRIFTFAGIVGACALINAIISAFVDNNIVTVVIAILLSIIVIGGSLAFLPKTIALVNVYGFLNVWFINLSGTVGQFSAFYQGTEECMPGDEAPHFSNSQYISNASLVNSLISLVAMWSVGVCMRHTKLRYVLWLTSLLMGLSALVDIVIIMRWNVGSIPDNVLFFLGQPSIQYAVYSINFLVSITLNAKLCPEGIETTVFGLMAASANFGGPISAVIANSLSNAFGLETECMATVASECNCNLGGGNGNFAAFIAINHIICPLILIPLTFLLLPDARLSDHILLDDEGRITEIKNHKQQDNNDDIDEDLKELGVVKVTDNEGAPKIN